MYEINFPFSERLESTLIGLSFRAPTVISTTKRNVMFISEIKLWDLDTRSPVWCFVCFSKINNTGGIGKVFEETTAWNKLKQSLKNNTQRRLNDYELHPSTSEPYYSETEKGPVYFGENKKHLVAISETAALSGERNLVT